jgi:drug/metabolite transporter (DMT)-like permease
MNIYVKVKFWSFLIIGVICIFIGAYLYPFGPDKRHWADVLLIIGVGQLVIFAVLLFLKYRRKNKEAAKA